jgi:hypothetical protein
MSRPDPIDSLSPPQKLTRLKKPHTVSNTVNSAGLVCHFKHFNLLDREREWSEDLLAGDAGIVLVRTSEVAVTPVGLRILRVMEAKVEPRTKCHSVDATAMDCTRSQISLQNELPRPKIVPIRQCEKETPTTLV